MGDNALLLALQASQGLIGAEVLAMSVQAAPDEVVIHVCLRADNEPITEDMDDLVSELEALFGEVDSPVRVTATKYVGRSTFTGPAMATAGYS